MEFDKVIEARRSVRKYRRDAVPGEAVRAMIEAARLGPSGMNAQPWRFAVVRDAEARAALADATPSRFIGEAPVIIVCCADREAFAAPDGRYAGFMTPDVVSEQLTIASSIAMTHLMLKAADLGLGSCWIGLFDEEAVRAAAGIGARYAVKALLSVGYPADETPARQRLGAEELILNSME